MDKKDKIQILIAIFTIILSPFFSWFYSYLSNTINPIIILYATLSTVFSIFLIYLFTKMFFFLGSKIIDKYNDFIYWKDIDGLIEYFEKELKNREIYVIKSEDLAEYIDKQNKIYKKSNDSVDFYKSIKTSTTDCMNRMVDKKLLFFIPTLRILILNKMLKCKKCDGNIKILDTVDHIEIKCEKCNQLYYIDGQGYGFINTTNDNLLTEYKMIYRLKNPNRIRDF